MVFVGIQIHLRRTLQVKLVLRLLQGGINSLTLLVYLTPGKVAPYSSREVFRAGVTGSTLKWKALSDICEALAASALSSSVWPGPLHQNPSCTISRWDWGTQINETWATFLYFYHQSSLSDLSSRFPAWKPDPRKQSCPSHQLLQ